MICCCYGRDSNHLTGGRERGVRREVGLGDVVDSKLRHLLGDKCVKICHQVNVCASHGSTNKEEAIIGMLLEQSLDGLRGGVASNDGDGLFIASLGKKLNLSVDVLRQMPWMRR